MNSTDECIKILNMLFIFVESPYRKRLSTAILKLQASQVLDELKRKWWEERKGGGQCAVSIVDQPIMAQGKLRARFLT